MGSDEFTEDPTAMFSNLLELSVEMHESVKFTHIALNSDSESMSPVIFGQIDLKHSRHTSDDHKVDTLDLNGFCICLMASCSIFTLPKPVCVLNKISNDFLLLMISY